MKCKKLNEKLFDGDEVDAYSIEMSFNTSNSIIQFKLKDLIDFSKAIKNITPNELSCIQSVLMFNVINFGGEKIFQGRKKGLKLYSLLKDGVIFLFSCGEFQPGRFQIFLEGYLNTDR